MKLIPGFPGYQITTDGRVWSEPNRLHNGTWIKNNINSMGYPQISLCKNGKVFSCAIHRILLETYIGPCPKGLVCRHLNGDPQDNRLENLCWGTRSANNYDAVKHGTAPGFQNKGNKNGQAKLTDQKVKLIYNLYHSGADTQQGLADAFGVGQFTISEIVRKKRWRHLWETK
jgi:hypothetical protein